MTIFYIYSLLSFLSAVKIDILYMCMQCLQQQHFHEEMDIDHYND